MGCEVPGAAEPGDGYCKCLWLHPVSNWHMFGSAVCHSGSKRAPDLLGTLAEYEQHRVDDVGFATAVGADHGGEVLQRQHDASRSWVSGSQRNDCGVRVDEYHAIGRGPQPCDHLDNGGAAATRICSAGLVVRGAGEGRGRGLTRNGTVASAKV